MTHRRLALAPLLLGAATLLVVAALAYGPVSHRPWAVTAASAGHPLPTVHLMTEDEARARFERQHPGEKPLNWPIAEAALRFHKSKPMGKFILGLNGDWGNDCSDFTAACVDAGLGVKARFERNSARHVYGDDARMFQQLWWRPGVDVQPGDSLSIRHSPWYEPSEAACWHVGLVGSDGMVYDFTKLKRWSGPRYGRHTLAEFVHNSLGERQVVIWRLHWRYRYRIEPLPKAAVPVGDTAKASATPSPPA